MGQTASTELDEVSNASESKSMGSSNTEQVQNKRIRTGSNHQGDRHEGGEAVVSGQRIPRKSSSQQKDKRAEEEIGNFYAKASASKGGRSNSTLGGSTKRGVDSEGRSNAKNNVPFQFAPLKDGEPHRKRINGKGRWTSQHNTEDHVERSRKKPHKQQKASVSQQNAHQSCGQYDHAFTDRGRVYPLHVNRDSIRQSQSEDHRSNTNNRSRHHRQIFNNHRAPEPRRIGNESNQRNNIQTEHKNMLQSKSKNTRMNQKKLQTNSTQHMQNGSLSAGSKSAHALNTNATSIDSNFENKPRKRMGKSARAMMNNGNKHKLSDATPTSTKRSLNSQKLLGQLSAKIKHSNSSIQKMSTSRIHDSSKRISSIPSITTEAPEVNTDNANDENGALIKDKEDVASYEKEKVSSQSRLQILGNERSSTQDTLNVVPVSTNIEVLNTNLSGAKAGESNNLTNQRKTKEDNSSTIRKKPKFHTQETSENIENAKNSAMSDMFASQDSLDEPNTSTFTSEEIKSSETEPSKSVNPMTYTLSSNDESNSKTNQRSYENDKPERIVLSSDDEDISMSDCEHKARSFKPPVQNIAHQEKALSMAEEKINNFDRNDSTYFSEENGERILQNLQKDLFSRSENIHPTKKRRISSCKSAIASNKIRVTEPQKVSMLKEGKIAMKGNQTIGWKSSMSDSTDSGASDSQSSKSYSEEFVVNSTKSSKESSRSSLVFHRKDIKLGTRADRPQNLTGVEVILDDKERVYLETKLERSSIDFLKNANLFSVQKLVHSSTSKLANDFKVWRRDPDLFDDIPCYFAKVARWQDTAKKFKKCTNDEHSISSLPKNVVQMQIVNHLTKTKMGGGGLPLKNITVMQGEGKILLFIYLDSQTPYILIFFKGKGQDHMEKLFDFRINIRKSKIPGSGHGAFLTFLGARKLKGESKQRSQDFLKDRIFVYTHTTKPLHAKVGNYNVDVKLKGHNLHCNGNIGYFYISRFPLRAKDPNSGREYNVMIGPHSVHEDIQELRERREVPHVDNGLGFLEIFSEDDYESDNETRYSSKEFGAVDIGRYGPFLKTGKKENRAIHVIFLRSWLLNSKLFLFIKIVRHKLNSI